jgi:hypothetical protein
MSHLKSLGLVFSGPLLATKNMANMISQLLLSVPASFKVVFGRNIFLYNFIKK